MTSHARVWAQPQPDEIAAMNTLLEQALIFPIGSMANWTQAIGHAQMRVVQQDGRIIAGLGVIPFGHWFGGRVVPAGGVTAVGVAPAQRGSGVGRWMLQQMLAEEYTRGVPLSTLYPATTAFYRSVGYERAVQRTIYELPLAALAIREPTVAAVPLEGTDLLRLPSIYAQRAAQGNGFIERPAMLWERLQHPEGSRTYTIGAERAGVLEGYVTFRHASWGEALVVRDLVALSAPAARRLLQVLGDHRSIIEKVQLPGAPYDPLLFQLSEQRQKIHNAIDLMVRIVDLPAALRLRGYPTNLRSELHLAVHDDLLPGNTGRWVLQVADGVGTVEAGGRGAVEVDIRALAALYCGYFTATELALAGDLRADSTDLRTADQIFAGPRPWLIDMF
jgi:predicted acetyltransferase